MGRPRNPNKSSQFNIYFRDDWKEELVILAQAESDKLGVPVSIGDLVRKAVNDKYKLDRRVTPD